MTGFVKVEGIEDLKDMFTKVAPKEARNLMRQTVQKIASNIAKDARSKVKVKTGNLKSSIKASRKKSHPDRPISVVKAAAGKKAKVDAYYWKFVEYGTKHSAPQPFIGPAKKKAEANIKTMLTNEFGKKLEKHLAKKAKKLVKK